VESAAEDGIDLVVGKREVIKRAQALKAAADGPASADVTRLDYLDFEAKLRARAGDVAELRRTIVRRGQACAGLRPSVVGAGGTRVAPKFDSHAAARPGSLSGACSGGRVSFRAA
jgi:hypothetical protein